jgi:hypothetical protein
MFDRMILNLRLADHAATTMRINATAWQRQGDQRGDQHRAQGTSRRLTLAARLDPARASVTRFTQPV